MLPRMCNSVTPTNLHALHREVRFRETEELLLNQPTMVLERQFLEV